MSIRAAVPLYAQRGHVLLTPPSAEPVTDQELRLHLRAELVDFPDAKSFITDARREIEDRTNVAFLTQTWRLAMDRWPAGGESWWDGVRESSITELYNANTMRSVVLPKWPLQSIASLTVFGVDGTPRVVDVNSVFEVDPYRIPGRITLKRGAIWPIALRASNAIQIDYVAGYTSVGIIPGPMRRAIKQLAGYLYNHRGDDTEREDAFTSSGASHLMGEYRAARI